jgi:hypothetical protein
MLLDLAGGCFRQLGHDNRRQMNDEAPAFAKATAWQAKIGGLLGTAARRTLAILARMPERRLKAFQNRQQGQFCQHT